jgi:MFS family permease
MHSSWFKITLPIAAIFAFRMLGLFMLIPVFSVYGQQLQEATPILIGVALGAYGFSQGMMQMPFGILSDYFGRKKILFVGLVLFALGSLIGAYTHSIYGMIFARIIQGCGAIGSVLIALVADLIDDQHRSKAMAIIGSSIGFSFAIAMVLSPIIAQHFGLTGIFQVTAILAMVGLGIMLLFIPKVTHQHEPTPFQWQNLKESFLPIELKKCHVGIWGQHFILTSSFFAIPLILKKINAPLSHFYLSLMLLAFVLMLPIIGICESRKKREPLFIASIIVLSFGQLLMTFIPHQIYWLWGSLFIYFTAFNILEALFPSMIAKAANPKLKGTATGIYSTMQFLGIFFGGLWAGFAYKYFGVNGIFIMNTLLCMLYILKFIIKK